MFKSKMDDDCDVGNDTNDCGTANSGDRKLGENEIAFMQT